MNFKKIHIGNVIYKKVVENKVDISRICNFFKCEKEEIERMYQFKGIDTENLLKWSKLLKYDFFRIYTQHLILYSPPSSSENKTEQKTFLPQFRKNIYTKEIIDFILEQIDSGEMTRGEVMNTYKIPKTTLYKWISKYK